MASFDGNGNKPKVRIIKKYKNRKLYDTMISCYITFNDLSELIKRSENFIVIESNSKIDITVDILINIIFDNERKADLTMPISKYHEIIKYNIGLSFYLLKMGLFTENQMLQKNNTNSQYYSSTENNEFNLDEISIGEPDVINKISNFLPSSGNNPGGPAKPPGLLTT